MSCGLKMGFEKAKFSYYTKKKFENFDNDHNNVISSPSVKTKWKRTDNGFGDYF